VKNTFNDDKRMKHLTVMRHFKYLIILFGVFCLSTVLAYAENETAAFSSNVADQMTKLQELKTQDPAAYQALIAQKKAHIKRSLAQLPQEKRAKALAFLKSDRPLTKQHLQYIKRHHPRLFENIRQNRMSDIQKFASNHPERFERLMQNHPGAREWFQKSQVKKEKMKEHFQKMNPEEKKRVKEKMKDRRPAKESPSGFNPPTRRDRQVSPAGDEINMRQKKMKSRWQSNPGTRERDREQPMSKRRSRRNR